MVFFTAILTAVAAGAGVLAAPAYGPENRLPQLQDIVGRSTPQGTGQNNGFFYSFWTDGQGSITYNNGAAGSYDVQWNNVGNFVAGKGWNPGSAKVVKYNGTWNGANVNSYLSLYGWTKSPLVEFYVREMRFPLFFLLPLC